MKVTDVIACKILRKVFYELSPDEQLFGASSYQFRKRWDMVMNILAGGDGLKLTPGHHYKRGMHIADLLWMMRLRSQSTLESYMQEVAAMNVLVTLSKTSRTKISLMSRSFNFLAA